MKKIVIIITTVILITAIVLFLIFNSKDYTIKELYIKNDSNQKIYAQLYKPKKIGKIPIVIYSHGLGASYRAGVDYAKELVKYGIATITIDFRGGANKSNSNGSPKDMSFLTEMDDIETIIEYVKELDFVDKDQIILMGSSQGGAVSALVSAKRDDLKGAVLLYPALGIPTHVSNWFKSKDAIPEEVQMTKKITVGPKYFLDIWDLDVYSEIAKDEKPILILQGTKDDLVSPEHSKKVDNIYKNSELYLIEGAEHGFSGKYFDEAMTHIVDYLEKIEVIK
jgi:hypothetical protein